MEVMVHLPDRAGSEHRRRRGGNQLPSSRSMSMADPLQTCADLIASTIAARIRELGGTDLDVRHLASSAAYAVLCHQQITSVAWAGGCDVDANYQ